MIKKTKKEVAEKLSKPKIMIIDAHVQSAISISTILEFKGYRTVQAYNKEDALDMIGKENPDLVIVDLTLDGEGSGCDVVKKLTNKKVILMGAGRVSKKSCGALKNIIGSIEKPIDSSKLLEIIKKKFP